MCKHGSAADCQEVFRHRYGQSDHEVQLARNGSCGACLLRGPLREIPIDFAGTASRARGGDRALRHIIRAHFRAAHVVGWRRRLVTGPHFQPHGLQRRGANSAGSFYPSGASTTGSAREAARDMGTTMGAETGTMRLALGVEEQHVILLTCDSAHSRVAQVGASIFSARHVADHT